MNKKKLVDMTRGPIVPQIIHFTLPLIIGNFFLYLLIMQSIQLLWGVILLRMH